MEAHQNPRLFLIKKAPLFSRGAFFIYLDSFFELPLEPFSEGFDEEDDEDSFLLILQVIIFSPDFN